jgi:4-hydroxy-tetrahydrodipicolinate synthase
MNMQGVWLPIITPFLHDELDMESYRHLIEMYLSKGISGIIPLGTTGESPTLSEAESEQLIDITVSAVNNRVPVYVGVGGNCTKKVLNTLKRFERYPIRGILSVCPYYNRPSQQGLFEHFLRIAEATALQVIIYNIPYRTAVNLENETLLKLAELHNVVAVKDSCGNVKQSLELIAQKPDNFSVLTGDDAMFYINLVHGGDGGILASSHLHTEKFVEIFDLIARNDHHAALQHWRKLAACIPLFFQEPNPAPVKYCLQQLGLIHSCETRLPITEISEELKQLLQPAV